MCVGYVGMDGAEGDQQRAAGAASSSVIFDLMQVYERLTQSSTPGNGTPLAPAPQHIPISNNHNKNDTNHNNHDTSHRPANSGEHTRNLTSSQCPSSSQKEQKQEQDENPNSTTHNNHHNFSLTLLDDNFPFQLPSSSSSGLAPNDHSRMNVSAALPSSVPWKVPVHKNNPNTTHSNSNSKQNSNAVMSGGRKRRSPPVSTSVSASSLSNTTNSANMSNAYPNKKSKSSSSSNNSISSNSGHSNHKKSRKKSNDKDQRWSKRFAWPEEAHRDFVSAVFDVGLKQSSPAALLEYMPKKEEITSERVKSHLQKYRIHRNKSRQEFINNYDAAFHKLNAAVSHRVNGSSKNHNEENIPSGGGGGLHVGDPWRLSGGDHAAYLTYCIMAEDRLAASDLTSSPNNAVDGAHTYPADATPAIPSGIFSPSPVGDAGAGSSFCWPALSEEEKKTPIGVSISCLFGMFVSLQAQLAQERKRTNAAGTATLQPQIQAQQQQPQVNTSEDTIEDGQKVQSTVVPSSIPSSSSLLNNDNSRVQDINNNCTQQLGESSSSVTITANPPIHTGGSKNNKIEHETNIMKREMQSQMELQAKMRFIMQQEMNKYSTHMPISSSPSTNNPVTQGSSNCSSSGNYINENINLESDAVVTAKSEADNGNSINSNNIDRHNHYYAINNVNTENQGREGPTLVTNLNSVGAATINDNLFSSSSGKKDVISDGHVYEKNGCNSSNDNGNIIAMGGNEDNDDSGGGKKTLNELTVTTKEEFDFWDTEVPDDDAVFEFLMS